MMTELEILAEHSRRKTVNCELESKLVVSEEVVQLAEDVETRMANLIQLRELETLGQLNDCAQLRERFENVRPFLPFLYDNDTQIETAKHEIFFYAKKFQTIFVGKIFRVPSKYMHLKYSFGITVYTGVLVFCIIHIPWKSVIPISLSNVIGVVGTGILSAAAIPVFSVIISEWYDMTQNVSLDALSDTKLLKYKMLIDDGLERVEHKLSCLEHEADKKLNSNQIANLNFSPFPVSHI